MTSDTPTSETTETPVRDELTIIRRIVTTLDSLDPRARARVVAYIGDRYSPAERDGA